MIILIINFLYRFNAYFQTKQVVINELHDKITSLYTDILLCFLKRSYVLHNPLNLINLKSEDNQLLDSNMYLGVQVMNHIAHPDICKDNVRKKDFINGKNYIKN